VLEGVGLLTAYTQAPSAERRFEIEEPGGRKVFVPGQEPGLELAGIEPFQQRLEPEDRASPAAGLEEEGPDAPIAFRNFGPGLSRRRSDPVFSAAQLDNLPKTLMVSAGREGPKLNPAVPPAPNLRPGDRAI
jgi:hypothetical protein